MAPKIAVITPTWNRKLLLEETMQSIAAQTYSDWEHIIVDDGSDDGTESMVLEKARLDPRVRYLSREGEARGANVCRNQAIAATSADFLVFLDSDDILAPEALGSRVAALERNEDCDFVTHEAAVFEKKLGDIQRNVPFSPGGDDLTRFLLFDLPWVITGPTWRKSSLEELGGFDESVLSWQDVEVHIRALASGCRYIRYPEIDHHIRWQFEATKTSILQRRSPKHLEAAIHLLSSFESMISAGPGLTWVRQRGLCHLYFFLAEHWVASGQLKKANDTWSKTITRRISSNWLWLQGQVLLFSLYLFPQSDLLHRLVNKWKGWVRFRINFV